MKINDVCSLSPYLSVYQTFKDVEQPLNFDFQMVMQMKT